MSDGVSPRLVGLNRHGDVSYLAGAEGVLSSTRSYDPFGAVVDETGPAGPDVGFQGDVTDPASGLVGMGARWYGPSAGVFVSRDSFAGDVRVRLSMNRYARSP